MHSTIRATVFTGRLLAAGLAAALAVACSSTPPPVVAPPGPDPMPAVSPSGEATATRPPSPPDLPPPLPPVEDPDAITARSYAGMSPQQINAESPLKPVFFAYDSDELDENARDVLTANAEVLKQYSSWTITIEGHCDERGTPEYNLALGDRRALAAKTYLQSLGISANRLHTVSYGKEFPFDPGHDDRAWAQNRRAHLMVTSIQ